MHVILEILTAFFKMAWDIAWGLSFGFILSSLIRAFVPTETIAGKLGKNSVAAVGLSTFFGAISSSCSYAAASMARTLIMKGATFSNAVAFMVASTNMVFEIFIVIVTLLGWPFFGGEVFGGICFIIISSVLVIWCFPKRVIGEAREKVDSTGNKTDGPPAHHSAMMMDDDSHEGTSGHHRSKFSEKLTQAAGHFYMDVTMVGKDILIGVALSSVLMVVVPGPFWKHLFLAGNSTVPHLLVLAWNSAIGIVIAIFAFVCSVGNIVLATVLWNGGISFGGVIAFILSDLVTFPMLLVYRSYFGSKTMWHLLAILSVSIFATCILVDFSFSLLHLIPNTPHAPGQMQHSKFKWDYGSCLNLFFIPAGVAYYFYGKSTMSLLVPDDKQKKRPVAPHNYGY